MKKFNQLAFTLITLFFLISNVQARDMTGNITDLLSWLDGHSVIRIENGPKNNCWNPNYYSLGVRGQDVKAPNMLSIALAAIMQQKPVHINTVDGSCQGGEEKITFISITK